MKKTAKSIDQDIWNHPDRLRKWTIEQLQRLDSDAYPNPLPSLLDSPGDPRLTWEARYLAEERAADEQIRNELRRAKKNCQFRKTSAQSFPAILNLKAICRACVAVQRDISRGWKKRGRKLHAFASFGGKLLVDRT